MGLLYGGGDFGKSLEIATRCGQDSDCNPASAGGILGTILGYSKIPAKWTDAVEKVQDMPDYIPLVRFRSACNGLQPPPFPK